MTPVIVIGALIGIVFAVIVKKSGADASIMNHFARNCWRVMWGCLAVLGLLYIAPLFF